MNMNAVNTNAPQPGELTPGVMGQAIGRSMPSRPAKVVRRVAGHALALTAATVLLTGAAACSSKKEQARAFEPVETPRAMRPPAAWNPGTRPIAQSIGSVRQTNNDAASQLVSSTKFEAAAPAASGTGQPSMAALPPGELIPVKYAASGAATVDVLRVLIQDFLEEDFVIDPSFTGNQPLTLSVDREMTRTEARDLVASLALMSGGRIERRGDMLILRNEGSGGAATAGRSGAGVGNAGSLARNPDTPLLRSQTAFGGAMPVIRVHTFRHVKADTLTNMLQAFLTPGATVVSAGTTLVVADSASNVDRVMGLIELLDVPAFNNVEVWTYRLRHRTPESMKSTLDAIAGGAGITGSAVGGADSSVAFVAVPGSDLLMVVAREPSVKEVVSDLIHQIDRPRDSMAKQRYLYRVQHFPTDSLAQLIAEYYAERVVTGTQQRRTTGDANMQPPADVARIVANEAQNIILIEATPDDYADIMATLRMVDRPPQQVFLRSVIAEVGLNDTLRYGVEYFLETQDIDGLGLFEFGGSAPLQGSAAATGSAFFVGTDGLAVVQALQTASEVAILSQPTLTIANNAEAEFQVGGSVPVVAADVDAATQVGGDTAIRRSIEYKDTGLILKIQPRINESGEVTLAIEQEINEVGNQNDLGPEFTTRLLKTTVTVPHGQTVVLGGIIRETRRDGTQRIPIVGSLPVVGALFQSRDITTDRTELFIAITPTIINTPNDAALVTSPFLDATHAVRRYLYELRDDLPEGSLVDARYLAMRPSNANEPQLFQVPGPGTPAQPQPQTQTQPPVQSVPAGSPPPEMPPIMRMLIDSANQQQGSEGAGSGSSSPASPR